MVHVKTIDAHAAGEPLRLIVDGFPSPHGRTMLEKREWLKRHADHLRRALMLEPRGHADMYGAILTEPVSPGSHAGVLFMHNEGYSTMCGHGIVAVTTIALERGLMMPGGDGARRSSTTRPPEQFALRRSGLEGWRGGKRQERQEGCGRVESVCVRERAVVRPPRRAGREAGEPHDSRRRRVWRRVLRHRRQRGGRPADRRRASSRTAARRNGDQTRDRGSADHRASARARASGHLRNDIHRAAAATRRRISETSRSSRTPRSTGRRAAPARRR